MKLNLLLAVNSWKRWTAVWAVVLAMAVTLASQTTQRANRITQELNSGPVVTISGTVHPLTRQASDLGEANPSMRLESMTLNIAPSVAEKAELDALVEAQQNPKSAQYHQWLTQEEFGARFGLTEADLSQVTGWLETQGFTVKSVAPSRNLITFSGTVAQAESGLPHADSSVQDWRRHAHQQRHGDRASTGAGQRGGRGWRAERLPPEAAGGREASGSAIHLAVLGKSLPGAGRLGDHL